MYTSCIRVDVRMSKPVENFYGVEEVRSLMTVLQSFIQGGAKAGLQL